MDIPLTVSFGLLLLFGALGGHIAHRFSWIPSITGFMLAGVLIGPSGLRLLTNETLIASRVFVDITLALILYRLGLSLPISALIENRRVLITSLSESIVSFILVFITLRAMNIDILPALMVAAIAISSSPAVLLHVANELHAYGIVTREAQVLIALNNLFAFIVFACVLPCFYFEAGASIWDIIFQPFYRLVASTVLGTVAGFLLHYIILFTRNSHHYRLAICIAGVMITLGIANTFKLSTLFAPLVLGLTIKSLEKDNLLSNVTFGEAFALFYIVLFVYAGANIHFHEIAQYTPAIVLLVVARSISKCVTVFAVSRMFQQPWRLGSAKGLLLIPMAGLAIGLAQTAATLFPDHAIIVTGIIFGAVSLFEFIGPPIAAYAFCMAGETGKAEDAESDIQQTITTQEK